MNNRSEERIMVKLREIRKRRWQIGLLSCLCLLVVVGVAGFFHLPATAKTYQKWVLTCPAEAPAGPGYAGFFLHTHNDDCFDENGNLVCPLPEIKAHVHDENCFVVSRELDCAIPESDGHQHTAECYTRVRGDLTCTLSTEPVLDEEGNVLEEGHVHTDECYAWHEELTCGKEAGEGAHHHDESCWRTVTTLTCDKPELIPHVHTDACYTVDEAGNASLICGMQELTEHVHGPECFTVYELDDGMPDETEETSVVTTESESGIETETVTETVTVTEIETETVTEETPAAEGTEEAGDGFIFLYPEEDETEAETGETAAEEKQEDGSTEGDAETGTESDTVIGAEGTETSGNTAETETADVETDSEGEETAEEDKEDEEPADKEITEGEQETEETGESEETPEAVPTRQLGSEKGGATVLAEVPESILGETARLRLDDYSADDARAAILSVVNENAAEGEEREIISLYVIDIGLDVNGEPVIPDGETPIRFTIRAKEIRGMTAPKVYQLINGTAVRIEEADFDPEAGTVSFTASGFSAFAIADLTGEDPADEAPEETPASVSMPAQTFSGETEDVLVSVTAPEGAFPEGTTMEVKMVELDDETMSSVEKAVEGKVTTVQAVDITFYDADGNKIEPQTAIQVSMKSAVVSESENVSLIHKPDAAETDDPEAEAPALEVMEAAIVEQEDTAAPSDEITFESNAFSVYMLVGTETITTRYLTADGETYLITLTYGPEAMIPEGAGLAVSEIPQDSEEYAAYLAQAQSAVNANTPAETDPAETEAADAESEAEIATEADGTGEAESPENSAGGETAGRVTVTTARFFDITIFDAEGNPVEPAAPVDVKIEYMEPAETAENYQVVHFGEETEVLNPAVSGADGTASAFDFKANSFSVFGVVGTRVITMDYITASGETYTITVTYGPEAGIPEEAELRVKEILPEDEKYTEYYQKSLEKVGVSASEEDTEESANAQGTDFFGNSAEYSSDLIAAVEAEKQNEAPLKKRTSDYARIFNIEIWADNQKIEPTAEVTVSIRLMNAPEDAKATPQVVHFAKNGAELIEVKKQAENRKDEEIRFVTEEFSVYSVVYTVDFSYEINGKVYSFSMEGADSVSLRALIETLHVYEKTNENNAVEPDIQSDEEATNEEVNRKENIQNSDLDGFMKDIISVSFSNPELLVPAKVRETTTVGKIKTDLKLFPTYPLGLSQEEVLELNAKEYTAGDWVLISLKPFDTWETLTIKMATGEVFTITVTDAQNAVMIGDRVQTVSNPAGTTIDLFDYWIIEQNINGRDAWGDLNQSWGSHEDTEGDDGYNLNGSGNNKGINSSTNDAAHGHALKFSPAWEGTVYNGTKTGTHRSWPDWEHNRDTYYDTEEPWRSLNKNGRDGLNSYTGGVNPFPGIVQNTLSEGYPALTINPTIGSNGESLDYLFSTSVVHNGKASYPNVNQLLYVDPEGYYTYDSRDYRAEYNDGTFILTEQTSSDPEIRGFWPFGIQNFWVGMHVNTQFSMPANGQVLNPRGVYKDMQFEFSGDDDTWLYVDGVLVGDGGGIHNRTEIDINFKTGIVSVTGQQDKYLDDIFKAADKYNDADWEDIPGSEHKRFKAGTYHTFDMFYLERGGGESNLYIHYNLVSTADFTAHKAYYGADETDILKRDQFQFELIGLDGKYSSVQNPETGVYELILQDADADADAIMPKASGTGEGTVLSPHYEDNVTTTLSTGDVNSQVYITGVTEDGNVNFGTAEISEMDMHDADIGNPPVYKYIIREIVPDDAVNAEGITWANANEEQKKAGGFTKDQVTYDGTVYYMTGRVTSWTETDAGGNEVVKHGISKTYYTDDTYTTVNSDVSFASFENRFTPDFGNVDFEKVDGAGHPLQGAVFALYKDEACKIPALDVDTEGHPAWTATSDTDGIVSFENVRVGTYYMKETEAPEGYKLSNTIYKIMIVDARNKTKNSIITRNDDETETQITKVFNTKISTEGLEVDKNWTGGDPSDDLTITYKLYQTSSRIKKGNYSVDVSGLGYGKPDWSATKYFTNDELEGNKTGIKKDSEIEVIITTTSDNWSFDTLNELTAVTSNQTILSDRLENISSGTVRQRTIRIRVTNESTNSIALYGQLESCYEGNGGKPIISCAIVSEPTSSENGETKLVGTVTLGKNTVSSVIENEFGNLDPAVEVVRGIGNWTSIIKNLPEEVADGEWSISYSYYVEEVEESIPSGYELNFISPSTGVPGDTITIVNQSTTPKTINIVVKKTDNTPNSTNFLSGAVFKLLYRADSSSSWVNAVTVVGLNVEQLDDQSQFAVPADGITLTGLISGQYQLQEITPPRGYLITETYPVVFTVGNGEITNTDGTSNGVRYTAASQTQAAEFIIPNNPGVELPQTGGAGTVLFTVLGGIMTATAGAILTLRKRKGHA